MAAALLRLQYADAATGGIATSSAHSDAHACSETAVRFSASPTQHRRGKAAWDAQADKMKSHYKQANSAILLIGFVCEIAKDSDLL